VIILNSGLLKSQFPSGDLHSWVSSPWSGGRLNSGGHGVHGRTAQGAASGSGEGGARREGTEGEQRGDGREVPWIGRSMEIYTFNVFMCTNYSTIDVLCVHVFFVKVKYLEFSSPHSIVSTGYPEFAMEFDGCCVTWALDQEPIPISDPKGADFNQLVVLYDWIKLK